MNTQATSQRVQRRESAPRSWGVRRGLLTPSESAGLPLLGGCLSCWPVLEASPGATARGQGYAGDGPPLRWQHGSFRPGRGFRASELRGRLRAKASLIAFPLDGKGAERLGQRSEEAGVQRVANPLARAWAGVRPSRRRPGAAGQPPAGRVECRTADLRPGGCSPPLWTS